MLRIIYGCCSVCLHQPATTTSPFYTKLYAIARVYNLIALPSHHEAFTLTFALMGPAYQITHTHTQKRECKRDRRQHFQIDVCSLFPLMFFSCFLILFYIHLCSTSFAISTFFFTHFTRERHLIAIAHTV